MLDQIADTLFPLAFEHIEKSAAKQITGSAAYALLAGVLDIAPWYTPQALNRLVKRGLLAKDPKNSSSRTKTYAPTEAGWQKWRRRVP